MSLNPDQPQLPQTPLVADGLRARRYKMGRTVTALILREMSTTYGRSPGGYIWALVEPILGLAFLVLVFSFIVRTPPVGNSFALFYATGLLPFMAFNAMANKAATAIRFSKPLLAYPVVTYFDALLARLLLALFTNLVIAVIIITALMMWEDTGGRIDPAQLTLSLLVLVAFSCGVGTMNCYLMTAFPVWERLWQVITRPLMLLSGMFYTFDSLPPMGQDILWWNPLIHIVGGVRMGIYPNYFGGYISYVYVMGVSSLLVLMGLIMLNRYNKMMMNEM